MIYIYSRKPSKGAKALAKALGGRYLRPEGTRAISIGSGSTVVNWGDSQCPYNQALNSAQAVATVANKLKAFRVFRDAGVPIPKFAETPGDVSWDAMTVVRHKLSGHSGEGIELCQNGSELPDAPLYVQYIKKDQEYRIHVGRSGDDIKIFAEQRKARRTDVPDGDVNWQIRNHNNGFVFVRQGFTTPDCVLDAAKRALLASGLDFGAVDVIYNGKSGNAYVLEINTAPGLEGQTIQDYRDYLSLF